MPPLTAVVEAMRAKGIAFQAGLNTAELAATETQYGFQFPPDLREFLGMALPVDEYFPNWRTGEIKYKTSSDTISYSLDWPARGLCFDVEHNNFWMPDWEPRPTDLQEAFRIAREMVQKAPPLIPVFSHRFLPADPLAEGNPVLSVYQTDIIYYGSDLANYWINEFKLPISLDSAEPRRIRFWSDIVDGWY